MKQLRVGAAIAALALAAVVLCAPASAQTVYSVTTLDRGRLETNSAFFAGPDRVIVNRSPATPRRGFRSFAYADGKFTDLGTLGGTETFATGANASGQVIGDSKLRDGTYRAFSWTVSGGMVELSFGDESHAHLVSEAGQVVGVVGAAGFEGGFSWTPSGGIVSIGYGYPYAVNDAGQVVGRARFEASGEWRAFVWTVGGGMLDLGTLGGTASTALAVTPSGQVVGTSLYSTADPESERVFVWRPGGAMVGIGTGLSSRVAAVDPSSGQVVGSERRVAGAFLNGFSWTPTAGYVDLGNLGGLVEPTALNAVGQVVGYATLASSEARAFSWTAAGGMINLGTLPPLDHYSLAHFVNRAGQVFGES